LTSHDDSQTASPYRSGFVTIIGRPNVGKSTLLNGLVGERVAIVTPKPQTTRHRLLGVRHFAGGQIVFLDTPGVHKARGGLNEYMLDTAMAAIADADLVYLMVEVGPGFMNKDVPGDSNRRILEAIAAAGKPAFLLINKIDLVDKRELLPFIERWRAVHSFDEVFPVSAESRDGLETLVAATVARLPQGPSFYDGETITDRTMRFLAAEIVREKTMLLFRDEVPYSIAVVIDEFRELDSGERFHIAATVIVERESQKPIVVGKGGQTIKKLGEQARKDMEVFFERPVGLKLFVKVKKDWTNDPRALAELGYK